MTYLVSIGKRSIGNVILDGEPLNEFIDIDLSFIEQPILQKEES